MNSLLRQLVVLAGVALALAPFAAADKEPVHFTADGQADARAAVIKRIDLGSTAAWTGGPTKPDLDSPFPACRYKPKQSDLVVTGAAESNWKAPGLEFDSESDVLETAGMVRLDWQRTVTAPQVLPCLGAGLAKAATPTEHLVSVKRIDFPQLTEYVRAVRMVLDVAAPSGGKVPVMLDVILVGHGRTEISLTTTAPYAERAAVGAAELRLAEILISRIRA
jgi:hypothetical protein